MLRTPAQLSRHTLYYSLQISGGLIALLGYLLFRIIPVALCIFIVEFFQAQKYEELILFLIGWASLFLIAWPIGKRVIGWGVDLMDYSERYKCGYLALLGSEYKKPTLEEYGLTKEQYYSYNRRFQFEVIDIVLTWGAILGVMYLYGKWSASRGFVPMLVVASMGACAGLSVHYFIQFLNRCLARRYPQYEKVEQYAKAKRIYDAIQEELREQRIKQSV